MYEEHFTSFAALALRVVAVRARLPRAVTKALDEAGFDVLYRIREKFGEYQNAVGPFPAWPELMDSTLERRERRGINADDEPLLESSDLRDSYTYEVQGPNVYIGSPNEEAIVHELGDSHVPARPVVGPAMLEYEDEYYDIFQEMWGGLVLHGRRFKRLRNRKSLAGGGGGSIYSGEGLDLEVSD